MTKTKQEKDAKPAKDAGLVEKYGAIGSGAILAALACKMREPDEKKKSKAA